LEYTGSAAVPGVGKKKERTRQGTLSDVEALDLELLS
jgi:hypothetical protein